MNLDKDLMLAYLREREAFGHAMAHDAANRDRHAYDGWQEYAHTVYALIQELESPREPAPEPVQECQHDWLFRPDFHGARCRKCGEERISRAIR